MNIITAIRNGGAVTPLLAAGMVVSCGTLLGQTVNWVEPAEQTSPSPRTLMGLAYFPPQEAMVLFGGSGLNDTWIWRGAWQQLFPATSPSPRYTSMVYDGASGNIMLFGGSYGSDYYNDTWTWDGINWTQQFPSVSPPPRVTGQMAYDPVIRRVVMFGGYGAGGYLGDTWVWDGTTWTEANPQLNPAPREWAAMAYDNNSKTVILFGGTNDWDSDASGDTWSWNGRTWKVLSPATAPSRRAAADMAFDPALNAVVLFGGALNAKWQTTAADTWTWNGTDWTQINPTTTPYDRYNFGMAYDPAVKGMMMFGGFSSGPALNDTWFLGETLQ